MSDSSQAKAFVKSLQKYSAEDQQTNKQELKRGVVQLVEAGPITPNMQMNLRTSNIYWQNAF